MISLAIPFGSCLLVPYILKLGYHIVLWKIIIPSTCLYYALWLEFLLNALVSIFLAPGCFFLWLLSEETFINHIVRSPQSAVSLLDTSLFFLCEHHKKMKHYTQRLKIVRNAKLFLCKSSWNPFVLPFKVFSSVEQVIPIFFIFYL